MFALVVTIAVVNLALGYWMAVWFDYETFSLPRICQFLKRRLPRFRKATGVQS